MLQFETLHSIVAFELPTTVGAAAARTRHSIETVLDVAGDSLVAVHAAVQRFGRDAIERELGDRGPKVLKAYDAFVDLIGDEWLNQESGGE